MKEILHHYNRNKTDVEYYKNEINIYHNHPKVVSFSQLDDLIGCSCHLIRNQEEQLKKNNEKNIENALALAKEVEKEEGIIKQLKSEAPSKKKYTLS